MNKHVERIQLEVDLDKSNPFKTETEAYQTLLKQVEDLGREPGHTVKKYRELNKQLIAKIGLTVVKYLEFLNGVNVK